MSTVSNHTDFRVFTTPEELRKIAERMEREFPDLLPGDDAVMHVWTGDKCSIYVCADRSLMDNVRKEGTQ